ncbi:MAG: DUF6029 family protein [Bacteroidota bacterium]|jgi:hypothetical protein|nr:DUF6029 family protein [Sphingobacteriales bacterium]
MKKIYFVALALASLSAYAQQSGELTEKGQFSGNFQMNTQFYLRDDKIGASTTQYLREKSSTEAWLFMNYKLKGFNFTVRYDLFNNSPLFNPFQAYTNQGLGYWEITKEIDKFSITGGYFYDQFGTGLIFRAYEDRNIGIDFAVQGARIVYTPTENLRLKVFTGRQKYRFDTREPVIKGGNIEYRLPVSENAILDMGTSLVNRTLDQNTMSQVANTINGYTLEKRFNPTYNVYSWNLYNTLNYKKFTLYLEYCNKSPEAILDYSSTLVKKGGNIYYASLSYATKGLGINGQIRRIETYPLRVNPLEIQPFPNSAVINYMPALTRQNTYRLLARYNSVVQDLGENAAQLEITFKPNKKFSMNINTSAVNALNGVYFNKSIPEIKWDSTTKLFSEFYVDASYKFTSAFKMMAGIQFIGYNQVLFEGKPQEKAPYVNAITPFGEFTYRLTPTRSVRLEWQYMHTNQDLGKFVNALVEYNIAPHWSFAAGDLINIEHGTVNKPGPEEKFEFIHYYNFFAAYTYKSSRLTAGFLKQPQGVNCTGGVCRVEPAFSGGRITLTTNF